MSPRNLENHPGFLDYSNIIYKQKLKHYFTDLKGKRHNTPCGSLTIPIRELRFFPITNKTKANTYNPMNDWSNCVYGNNLIVGDQITLRICL